MTVPVTITGPALPATARVARMALSSLAATNGFNIDEVEDLRLALNELFSTLLAESPDGDVEVSISVTSTDDGTLTFKGRRPGPVPPDSGPDALQAEILGVVLTSHDGGVDDDGVWFEATKRRSTL